MRQTQKTRSRTFDEISGAVPGRGGRDATARNGTDGRLHATANLAEVLRAELAKPNCLPSPINIGSNTDPYRPIEKHWRLTRAARRAGYTTLRLPYELKALFHEWLALHAPQRAAHVMSLVQQTNGGRDYDSNFATRMHGHGVFADLLRRRFEVACRKHGFARELVLDTSRFVPPR